METAERSAEGYDFDEVVRRLRTLASDTVSVGELGEANGYPLLAAKIGQRTPDRLTVLMTAGVHGDEPAGVEAVLRFIEGPVEAYLDRFFFVVVPCVNPSGYALGTRANATGRDINRGMSDDSIVESVILRRFIAGRHFDLFFDHHEDYEATGFYIYEAQREGRLLGERMVKEIKSIGPVDGDGNTDARLDLPISEGLYGINPKWKDQGWSAYAYYQNAEHVVLCETPSTAWPLDQRVEAHLAAVRIALDHYGDAKSQIGSK